MAVTPVNNQAITASQTSALVKSLNTPTVSTNVTSTDPTVLKNQANQLAAAISQLQNSGGSTQQVQKLQQALITAKNQIEKQQDIAEEKNQSSSSVKPFTRGIDTKA